MYITFYDSQFGAISSPIDTFESLIWTERWYEPGSFRLALPASHFLQANDAAFVYNRDVQNYMIIDEIEVDSDAKIMTITGSSLESLFDWRVMYNPTYYTAHVEDTARAYVTIFATNSVMPTLAFVNTPITLAAAKNYTESANIQTKAGILLSDAIRYIYKPLGWTYTLKRGAGAGLIFNTVKGLDRSGIQTTNQRAMFFSSKGDIENVVYTKNKKDYHNYVFMRTTWNYDKSTETANGTRSREYNGALSGEERRFIYLTGEADYTTIQMDSLCKTELLKYPVSENITGEISPNCSLVYGTDYALGDWCDVVINETRLAYNAQITAVDRVYEKGNKKIIPVFGEEKLNPRRFIKREAGK